jgi:hypothetical protein
MLFDFTHFRQKVAKILVIMVVWLDMTKIDFNVITQEKRHFPDKFWRKSPKILILKLDT